jgi:ABC-type transport system involved in multi-copper enzyme maturation permease subunit
VRNFIAVLKDSFREAVDGFLIWLMLGLATLVILLVAMIGYDATSAGNTFPAIVSNFNQAFRGRGTENIEIGTRSKFGRSAEMDRTQPMTVSFIVGDVKKAEDDKKIAGTYTFRISVSGKQRDKGSGNIWDRALTNFATNDEFRMLVASWAAEKPLEKQYLVKMPKVNDDGSVTTEASGKPASAIPKLEPVPEGMTIEQFKASKTDGNYIELSMPDVSTANMKAVSTVDMIDFLKQQFNMHGDITDLDIVRIDGVKEPEYQFEVTARVKGIPKGWRHNMNLFFGAMPLGGGTGTEIGKVLITVQDWLINTIGASIIFTVSLILTAFFIPNMLRKGAVDLLIVKPISRWQLLLYKYIGGCTFVLMVVSYAVVGVWFVMWARSGVVNPSFLLSIPLLTFTFAVLYGISMLMAVLTRSAIAAIVVSILFMVFVWVVGLTKTFCDTSRNMPELGIKTPAWLNTTCDVLNAGLPRYNDLLKLNSRNMQSDVLTISDLRRSERLNYPSWGEALGISMAWIVGLYLLSYWRFATRDP